MPTYRILSPDQLTDLPHLSISQLRLLLQCPHAWELRYLDRLRGATSAAAWYGSLVHRIVALRYRGLSFAEAHAAAWEEVASQVVPLLAQLPALDAELTRLGGLRSTRGKSFYTQSGLARLLSSLADYQHTRLSDLRWTSRQSLADYYLQSHALLSQEDAIVLPGAFLVEGEPLDGSTLLDADSYKLLEVELDGETLVGVPDVVAREPDGTITLADYKSGRALATEELNEDAQLAFYVLLLRAAGLLALDQQYRTGHIYLHAEGVRQVWADTSQHDRVIERLRAQIQLGRAIIAGGVFAPAKSLFTGFTSRCALCDYAHHCRA